METLLTKHQAKYFAYELERSYANDITINKRNSFIAISKTEKLNMKQQSETFE